MVYFEDKNHKYFTEDGSELVSTSALIDKYKVKFEEDQYVTLIKAFRMYNEQLYQRAKNSGIKWYEKERILNFMVSLEPDVFEEKIKPLSLSLIQKYKDYGMERAEYGTGIHTEREIDAIQKGFRINPFDGKMYKVIGRASGDGYDNSYILPEILKMKEDVCVLECLLTYKQYAGQEDKVFLKYMGGGNFIAMLMDYKTDKAITQKSMWIKNDVERFKNQLHYFNTGKIHTYSLKTSVYSFMIESTGKVKVASNFIEHIPENKERSFYRLNYYKEHIKLIINM